MASEHTPDDLLTLLEGSAEEAVKATGQKVQTMQTALMWLIEQQKVSAAAAEAAAAKEAALTARIDELETKLTETARQQSEQLQAGLDAASKALSDQAAASEEQRQAMLGELQAATTDVGALKESASELATRVGAVEEKVELAAADVSALKQESQDASQQLADALGEAAKASAAALEEALGSLTRDRLGPLEELAHATSKRVNEVENSLDLRFVETESALTKKLEERSTFLEERMGAAEAKLDAGLERLDALAKSRQAPPPGACAVSASSTAADAMDVGDVKESSSSRLGHVEWLLDALQGDFEAMHSSINKVKAEQAEHTETLRDLQSANAAAFNEQQGKSPRRSARGSRSSSPAPPPQPPAAPATPAEPSAAAPAPAPIEPRAAQTAAEGEGGGAISLDAEGVQAVTELQTRLEALESKLAAEAEARGESGGIGGVPSAVREHVEASVGPLMRALKTKAEQSELVRLEALCKALVDGASPRGAAGGGGGGGDGGGGTAVAMALAQLASDTSRGEAMQSTLDEVSAAMEQLKIRVASFERSMAVDRKGVMESVSRLQEAMEGEGVARAAEGAVRRAMAPPLELLALSVIKLVEGERWGDPLTSDDYVGGEGAGEGAGGVAAGGAGGGAGEGGGTAKFAAALQAFRPKRAEAAAAGGGRRTHRRAAAGRRHAVQARREPCARDVCAAVGAAGRDRRGTRGRRHGGRRAHRGAANGEYVAGDGGLVPRRLGRRAAHARGWASPWRHQPAGAKPHGRRWAAANGTAELRGVARAARLGFGAVECDDAPQLRRVAAQPRGGGDDPGRRKHRAARARARAVSHLRARSNFACRRSRRLRVVPRSVVAAAPMLGSRAGATRGASCGTRSTACSTGCSCSSTRRGAEFMRRASPKSWASRVVAAEEGEEEELLLLLLLMAQGRRPAHVECSGLRGGGELVTSQGRRRPE